MASFDPLASTQINLDPAVRTRPAPPRKPQGAPADPLAVRIAQLTAAGFSEEEARSIAEDELRIHGAGEVAKSAAVNDTPQAATTRAGRVADLRRREGQQAGYEASMGEAYGTPAGDASDIDAILGRKWVDGKYEKVTPMGPKPSAKPQDYGRRLPGPRTLDGKPVDPGAAFQDADEAAAYDDRGMDELAFTPSQKDRDMEARGMVPIYNPDGSVGYAVAAPESAHQPLNEAITGRGAPGREGARPDLSKAGYEIREMPGPLGMRRVYVPGARQSQQEENVDKRRLARRIGITPAQAAGMSMDDLRLQAQGAADADAADRKKQWKAQTMLSGGRPTGGIGGSRAIVSGMMMLPPDQFNSSMRYMLPGGQLAAGVDAANAATAGKMAQQAMTAFLTNNPAVSPEQRAVLEQRAREANPAGAGASDIAAGKLETPEAQAELARLAASMDTGWFGVNDSDVTSMADALMKPPYNLSQPQAEELAYRYVNKRSWLGVQRPGGAAPPAGDDPYNPAAPYGL